MISSRSSQVAQTESALVDSVMDLVTVSLKESFARMLQYWRVSAERPDPGAEAVHQLRVSSRRVVAALDQFARFLPRRKTESLRRDLNGVRKSAGQARDCDVFSERIVQRTDGPAAPILDGLLRKHRRDAQQTLVDFYQRCEGGERLERHAAELLAAIRPRGRRTRQVVLHPAEWASRRLRVAMREFFQHCDIDTRCIEQLHELRIHAKKFRYELEFLAPVLPNECAAQAVRALKKLLQRLGEINDHAAAIQFLTAWLREPLDPESRKILRKLRKDERHALSQSMSDFAEWWTPRRRRRLRSRVKHASRIDDHRLA